MVFSGVRGAGEGEGSLREGEKRAAGDLSCPEQRVWVATPHFSLSFQRSRGPGETTQWRILLTRKLIRHATERNRWRRRIREAIRRNQGRISPGHLGILRLRAAGAEPSFSALEEEIDTLLKKSGLWVVG